MAFGVDVVATGSVVRTAPGRRVVTHGGEAQLQFELVTIRVDNVFRSTPAAAADIATGQITVERLGRATLGDGAFEPDFEGGPFATDRPQLLFLQKQDAAPFHYLIANGEGKFSIDGGGVLVASRRGAVADALNGTSLAALQELIARL